MTARKRECDNLSPTVIKAVKKEDALKPVSPKEDPINEEGLSQNGETDEGQEEVEMEEESSQESDEVQEGRASKGQRPPREPTKAEREEHERTHCPYRNWCKHCVKSRARNSPHRNCVQPDPLEERKVPRVHMDYFFMSREDEKASKNPLIVVADERSGSRYARAVSCKGLGEGGEMDWLIEDISTILKSWGHGGGTGGELIMKSDGEPALLAVRNAVIKYHGGVIVPEAPAKGEKAENGFIEEAGKTVREYVCTFLSRIEDGVDDTIPLDGAIIPWIVRWAAICHSRYAVGKDGRTAYERLRGRTCKAIVVPMGEKVWDKQLGDGGDRRNKAETEWFPGIWLGPANSSSETLIDTRNGVVKASTIKRFGLTEKWDINAILEMKGTPQRPDPTKPGLNIPVQIRLEPEMPFEIPEMVPVRSEEGPRRAYIMKQFFEEHGYSEGCDGCGCLAAGLKKKRPHSDKCRNRIYEEMRKTEKGRKHLEEADNKQAEFYEARLKKDHGERGGVDQETKTEEAVKMDDTVADQPTQSSSSADPIGPAADRSSSSGVQQQRPEADEGERMAKRQKATGDPAQVTVVPSTGSSGSGGSPTATAGGGGAPMKRPMIDGWNEDEAPEKTQKINSICLGMGSSDKIGEFSEAEYKQGLEEMAEAYSEARRRGGHFVHIRKVKSSNRDLRTLNGMTDGAKLYKVNLGGSEVESIVTDSQVIAKLIESARCDSIGSIEKAIEEEVKGKTWESDKIGFEQHMLEEEKVRLEWMAGGFEKNPMKCSACGNRNVWDKAAACCEKQCQGALNALQSFPFAAWDDISSAPLKPEKVVEARKLEMAYAASKPVWKKVPRSLAKEKGWKIIKSRWIDINKGDDLNPNYRSRMVGKEFNDRTIDGLFAATPPLEALRLILSWASTSSITPAGDATQREKEKKVLIADVSRAFFEAPAKRDICVELPEEALSAGESVHDTVGKLLASLYGTRDASKNWQEEVAKCMASWGFITGKYNPCMFHHVARKILCLVHGDDFVCVGDEDQLKWMKVQLQARFEVKTKLVGSGGGKEEVQEARILNRIIRCTDAGWEYEADQRHVDLIVKETGADGSSTLSHPGGDKKDIEKEEDSEELQGAEGTRFRAVAARANYLAADRPDIQYAVKEICRKMAKPVRGDWQKLVRLGRYLKGAPRCVLEYAWQEVCVSPTGYSDSDWAGDRKTGKSTSGGIIMMGSHLVKSWSRTQDAVTLSSAEAELTALGKLAMEMLGVRSMTAEWTMTDGSSASVLWADASAALSIAKRQGAGKMRHINVKTLWLQEKVVQDVLAYSKIKGEENPADGLTKHVRKGLAEKYAKTVGMKLSTDRASTGLTLVSQ